LVISVVYPTFIVRSMPCALRKEEKRKRKRKNRSKLLVCVTQYPLKASLILSCNLRFLMVFFAGPKLYQ
jgi:hypothetical protein